MKVLVVGGGGREHALAWKLSQSINVTTVYVAPGNAGTHMEPGVENINIAAGDASELLKFARKNKIALTVVGPEGPLVEGLVDRFSDAGLACFGPTAAAARLEGSKAFCKAFLARHRIPTAQYGEFNNREDAVEYVRKTGAPMVVKADGLAAGKGVTVAHNEQQAISAIDDCLGGNRFGTAGHRVVIEEFLDGEEASFICVVSGRDVLPMATSQDHKARDDGDLGPNTGGMGAYSPAPVVDQAMHGRIMEEVIYPTVNGLADEGIHYVGFLYAGLMIGKQDEPRVLEFNCRFGDPETQPIMMRMGADLAHICGRAVAGDLTSVSVDWDSRPALGIVLAAGGYPDGYENGLVISGLDQTLPDYAKVFHSGTQFDSKGNTVTAGGRVLCVTALGDSIAQSRDNAYAIAGGISWPGMFHRNDIGYRAIQRG